SPAARRRTRPTPVPGLARRSHARIRRADAWLALHAATGAQHLWGCPPASPGRPPENPHRGPGLRSRRRSVWCHRATLVLHGSEATGRANHDAARVSRDLLARWTQAPDATVR